MHKNIINSKFFRDEVLPLTHRMYFYTHSMLSESDNICDIIVDALCYLWENRKNIDKDDAKLILTGKVRELANYRIQNSKFSCRPFKNTEWEEGNYESILMPRNDDVEYLMGFLPQLHSEIITLRGIVELDDDSIARVSGLGFNNIQSILADARKLLRKGIDTLSPEWNRKEELLLSQFYSGQTCVSDEQDLGMYLEERSSLPCYRADYCLLSYFKDKRLSNMPPQFYSLIVEKVDDLTQSNWLKKLFWRSRS